MLSDFQICQYLGAQYAGDRTAFDIFDEGSVDGIAWAARQVEGITYIFLRGSVTFQDWMRDLVALAAPFTHDVLGPIHPGFLIGMADLWREIDLKIGASKKYVVAGHSLGAGRADILSAIMATSGFPPARTVCFGEPKPGFQKLADILSKIPRASYRNGNALHHDLVTDVPLSFPPEEFVHPSTLIPISATPPGSDKWGIFSWHHIQLYEAALAKV